MRAPGATDPAAVSGPVGARVTVPTHVSPAGGQTTHPSVVYVPGGWNGYEYWMAHTPYPGGVDDHEDPNICASHDGIDWAVPDGLVNPIDDADGSPEYNSDVDLRMGPSDTLYLFWRFYDTGSTGTEERLYYSTSTDGVTWSAKTQYWVSDDDEIRLVSPSMLYEDGRWVMWAVDVVPSPNRVVRLEGGATPTSGWGPVATVDVGEMAAGREPWHLSIHRVDDDYVGLLTTVTLDMSGLDGDILFVTGQDGLVFANNGTASVIPRVQADEHDALYRATLVREHEDDAGYRVWYSAWLVGPPRVWNVYRTFLSAPLDVDPDPEEPEEPERPDIAVAAVRPEVTWLGCDLVTGRVIAELRDIEGTVSRVLGAYTSTGLTLPIPLAGPGSFPTSGLWEQATVPGQTMIVPVVNDVPAAGYIVLRREGGTAPELRLACVSLEGYLARYPVEDHTWTDVDLSVIAAGLVADAQVEGIGLVVDTRTIGGEPRSRSYQRTDDASVYQRLTELSEVESGIEWTIDVDWADSTRKAIAKVLRVRGRIGLSTTRPHAVFSSAGSSDATYTFIESYEDGRGANYITATSSGEGESRPESTPAADVLPGWPRWPRRFSPSSSISDQAVLDAHAVAELARLRDGSRTWEITARWDAPPRLGVDWRLGDDVGYELTGHRHPDGATGVERVIGWELDMSAGTVRPILLEV